MSCFNPRLSILKQMVQDLREKREKKNKTEEKEKLKDMIKNGEKNNKDKTISKYDVNKVLKKREFERIFNKYLFIKRKTYFREVKDSKKKREFKFDKLNYDLNKYTRNIVNPDYKIENGIVSKTNILRDLNIDLTFEKVWAKLSSNNYQKFNEKYDNLKDKSDIIFRKIKKDERNCSSARNIRIKEIKKLLGDKIFDKEIEEKKIDADPFVYLLQRKTNKKENITTNNIDSARNTNLFSSQKLNVDDKNIKSLLLKRNTVSLKNIDFNKIFYNIQIKSENENKSLSAKKKLSVKENIKKFISELNNFKTAKKVTNKKLFDKKLFNKKHSRNKIVRVLSFNSENNKTNFFQEYKQILKSNKKLKLNYLKNHLIPFNQVDSIMKTREEMLVRYLMIKYNNFNITFKKNNKEEKIKPNRPHFKEKLMKSAELFFS